MPGGAERNMQTQASTHGKLKLPDGESLFIIVFRSVSLKNKRRQLPKKRPPLANFIYFEPTSVLARSTVISTRRFLDRPAEVSFEVTGRVSAYPAISNLPGASLLLSIK